LGESCRHTREKRGGGFPGKERAGALSSRNNSQIGCSKDVRKRAIGRNLCERKRKEVGFIREKIDKGERGRGTGE